MRSSPTPASSSSAKRSQDLLRRPGSLRTSILGRTCGNWCPTGSTTSRSANFEMPSRASCGLVRLQGARISRSLPGCCPAVSANRLNLALTLKMGGNLLLLDEPTNDLDVETLQSLEDRAARLSRLRRGDLPRPLVPRPGRDPHPRLGRRRPGRVQMVLVRGQLRRLRGQQDLPARRGGGPPAPRDPPPPHPLISDLAAADVRI